MLSLRRVLIPVLCLALLATLVPATGGSQSVTTRMGTFGQRVTGDGTGDTGRGRLAQPTSPGATLATPAASSPAGEAACAGAEPTVSDAAELTDALAAARPGDTIVLADGTYEGEFGMRRSGRTDAPITLCGGHEAIITTGSIKAGYAVHLEADHWVLDGFTVTESQKGIMLDAANGNLLRGLTVHAIGDEGVHLRTGSSDNVLRDSEIFDTGQRRDRFGEGVYIGTAKSNWCDVSDCDPDQSNRNQIIGNVIRSTTSESIDVKEGTTGGVIADNTFTGDGMNKAESWVNVKGNGYLVTGNRGTESPRDGFQTFIAAEGWGQSNRFVANHAEVSGEGFGFRIDKDAIDSTVITCDNVVIDAGAGFSNTTCDYKMVDGLF